MRSATRERIQEELVDIASEIRGFYKQLSDPESKAAFNNQTLIGASLLYRRLGEIQEELEGIGDVLDSINKKLTQTS